MTVNGEDFPRHNLSFVHMRSHNNFKQLCARSYNLAVARHQSDVDTRVLNNMIIMFAATNIDRILLAAWGIDNSKYVNKHSSTIQGSTT